MKRLLLIGALTLAGCRLNPECFDSTECSGGAECIEGSCVGEPDLGTVDLGMPDGQMISELTWFQDVQPIVARRCQGCHQDPPRSNAPMALVAYRHTQALAPNGRPYFELMAARVVDARAPMPPVGSTGLLPDEIEIIRRWASEGASPGTPPVSDAGVSDLEPVDDGVVDADAGPADIDPGDTPDGDVGPVDMDPMDTGDIGDAGVMDTGDVGDADPLDAGDGGDVDPADAPAPDVDAGQAPVNPVAGASMVTPIAGPGTFMFLEGPAVNPLQDTLLFSDIPANTIYSINRTSFAVTASRSPSRNANGLVFAPSGAWFAAEHSGRQVTRTSSTGQLTVVTATYQGARYHSPNDLVLRSDGALYFTDPPYGGNPAELGFNGLFLVQGSTVTAQWQGPAASRPNGVTLSPDETLLYMTDTSSGAVMVFDVAGDGTLGPPRTFVRVTASSPDGMAMDVAGNVYVATTAGIEVFDPTGLSWGTIVLGVANPATNISFGGLAGRSAFITAGPYLFRVNLPIAGAR